MRKLEYAGIGLVLTIVLIFGVMPKLASAARDNLSDKRLAGSDSAFSAGPVGRLIALSAVTVDGRSVQGEQALWGGELLQAPPDRSINVMLNSIGQVVLGAGAVARFSAAPSGRDDTGRHTMIGSLESGQIDVRLSPEGRAYIEAAGSTYRASRGSSFSLAVRDGRAVLKTATGDVVVSDQAPQRRYILRPVGSGSTISVRARSTRQIQIQVTDENDKPVPDLPIVFALAGAGGKFAGTLGPAGSAGGTGAGAGGAGTSSLGNTFTASSNRLGQVTVQLNTGDTTGSDTLNVTTDGGNALRIGITVTPAVGFWTTGHKWLVFGIAAAAGIAIGIATTRDSGNQNLNQNQNQNQNSNSARVRPGPRR